MEIYQLILLATALSSFIQTVQCACNDKRTCVKCVKVKSWFGNKRCRWCPRNNECHTYGSWVNPCKSAENIKNKEACSAIILYRYDPTLAYKMMMLSAAAYDERNPQTCLSNGLSASNFDIKTVVSKSCDLFGNVCSGFVAVSHTEKAIALSFRGSVDFDQVFLQFVKNLASPKQKFLDGEVQIYWLRAFKTVWKCLSSDFVALHQQYPSYKVWITGHSLGGTLASLASTLVVHTKLVSSKDVILYTFGMPRVGNHDYALQHDQLVKNSWRVVNKNDPVPHFPTLASWTIFNGPYHHGIEVYYGRGSDAGSGASHKECHGKPYNEDLKCSFTDNPLKFSIKRHKRYFGIPVGTYWKNKCGGTSDATADYKLLINC